VRKGERKETIEHQVKRRMRKGNNCEKGSKRMEKQKKREIPEVAFPTLQQMKFELLKAEQVEHLSFVELWKEGGRRIRICTFVAMEGFCAILCTSATV
jgi:hypothetical protein